MRHVKQFCWNESIYLCFRVQELHLLPNIPLISLSKSESIRWVRLKMSYSFSAFVLASVAENFPLSGNIWYRRNVRNSFTLAENCSMLNVFSRSMRSSM